MRSQFSKLPFVILCGAIFTFIFLPSTVSAQACNFNYGSITPNCRNVHLSTAGQVIKIIDTSWETSGNCTDSDKQQIRCFEQRGNVVVPQQTIDNEKAAKEFKSTKCWYTTGTWGDFMDCLWYSFIAFFGAIPISIGIWLVTTFGGLFNSTVDYTIVQFASKVYSSVEDGINVAWQAFRDVANIVIIGMFTFIAISMILGNERYGAKKMVARVLVIAVLINFSLLFTKIIIDSSNFTAKVFYDASSIQTGAAGTLPGIGTDDISKRGISGRFLDAMGITTFKKTEDLVFNLAKGQKSGWLALVYGIFIGVLLLLIAFVFLYAVFLLIARAVLLIFLMMVSSLAFASYLIPKFAEGEYGWNAWWNALLRNAVFAPLLMMFLWATLAVAEAFAKKNSGGGLGPLITNPTEASNILALFNFLLVLGLLFAAIKLSSSFSSRAGVGFAKFMTGGVASFAAGAVGFAGRNILGRGAGALARVTYPTKDTPWWSPLRPFHKTMGGLERSSFDARKIPGVAYGAKYAGLDIGRDRGRGGYVQSIEDKEKKLLERETAMAKLVGTKTNADIAARRDHDAKKTKDEDAQQKRNDELRRQMAEDIGAARDEGAKHDEEKTAQKGGAAGTGTQPTTRQSDADATEEKERAQIIREVSQGVRTGMQESRIQATLSPEELARQQVGAKHEGESTRREEEAKIQRVKGLAQAAGREEIDKELAERLDPIAERYMKAKKALEEGEVELKRIQAREFIDPAIARRREYIESIPNQYNLFTFPLDLGRTRSYDLKKKVEGEVIKTREQRVLEQLIKDADKIRSQAGRIEGAAEKIATAPPQVQTPPAKPA